MKISDVLPAAKSDGFGQERIGISLDQERADIIFNTIKDAFLSEANVQIPEQDCADCGEACLSMQVNWNTVGSVVDENLEQQILSPLEEFLTIKIFLDFAGDHRAQVDLLFKTAHAIPRKERTVKQQAFVKFIKKARRNTPNIGQLLSQLIGLPGFPPGYKPETNDDKEE